MDSIKIIDKTTDKFLKTTSILIKISAKDYIEIAENIFQKNQYQRREVNSSKTIYKLLKRDLLKGCLIPPIVLALQDNNNISNDDIMSIIKNNKDRLVILDGLQRTLTLISLKDENSLFDDLSNLADLRVEILIGLEKSNLLYRMLTLNTGQTPMSTRHQIEILYSDYLENSYNGISLITEKEGDNIQYKIGEYSFKDIIDGYTSYIEKSFHSIDRIDILTTIESLRETLSDNDKFSWFLDIYHNIVVQTNQKLLTLGWKPNLFIELDYKFTPFGTNAETIYVKSQALTGLGYALKKLEVNKKIYITNEILIEQYKTIDGENFINGHNSLITKLEQVKTKAKKIGNGQRMLFGYFFWYFLDSKNSDTYFDMEKSVYYAFEDFQANI